MEKNGTLDSDELFTDELKLEVPGFTNNQAFLDICFGGFDKFKQNYASLFINNRNIYKYL